MKTMIDISQLNDKKVLLRCDFDLPVSSFSGGGRASKTFDFFRAKKQKPVIDLLLKQSSVVIVSHIEAIQSFKNILSELEDILGQKLGFIDNLSDLNLKVKGLKRGEIYILDNVRKWPGEEKNDDLFAETLGRGFDLYINNAFAVCHRNHASVSAITKYLPSYAGLLIEEEINGLKKGINSPAEGKIVIIGGAKASTKVPVIKNFIDKAEYILLGGVVANDVLKKRGIDVMDSVVDENIDELLEGLDINNPKIILPEDFNISNRKIYGLGPKTIARYTDFIKNSKIVIWNGPVGLFEIPRFRAGTIAIAEALAEFDSKIYKILGGGDTIAAVNSLELLDKFDFVSTGGGAMLAFLAGDKLPGLDALNYHE